MSIQSSNVPSFKDQHLLEDYERHLSLLDGLLKKSDLQKEEVTRLKERLINDVEASEKLSNEIKSLKNRVVNRTPELTRYVGKEKSERASKFLNMSHLRCAMEAGKSGETCLNGPIELDTYLLLLAESVALCSVVLMVGKPATSSFQDKKIEVMPDPSQKGRFKEMRERTRATLLEVRATLNSLNPEADLLRAQHCEDSL